MLISYLRVKADSEDVGHIKYDDSLCVVCQVDGGAAFIVIIDIRGCEKEVRNSANRSFCNTVNTVMKEGIAMLSNERLMKVVCYVMLGTFVWIWWPTAREYLRLSEAQELASLRQLPQLGEDALIEKANALLQALVAPVQDNPQVYRDLMHEAGQLGLALHRYRKENRDRGEDLIEHKIQFRVIQEAILVLYQRYSAQFPELLDLHQQAVNGVWCTLRETRVERPSLRWGSLLPFVITSYWQTTLLAIFFFGLRLKEEGFALLLETWRLPTACASWPVAFFVYPTWIDPRRQYRQAKQFVIYAFSLLTSIVGVSATSYAQQNGSSRPKVSQIDKPDPAVTWSLQGFSQKIVANGRAVHPEPVVQSEVAVTWQNGFFGRLFGQTSLDGEANLGREVNGTVGWGGRYGSVGLTYFDLNPPLDTRNADVWRPFGELAWPILFGGGHSLAPYARFEYMQATHHGGVNSGAFLFGGLRHRWATKYFGFDQVGWVMYDGGVFRSERGFMGRYELAPHVKFGPVTVDPVLLRLSVPLAGIRDRDTEVAIGAGISVALH